MSQGMFNKCKNLQTMYTKSLWRSLLIVRFMIFHLLIFWVKIRPKFKRPKSMKASISSISIWVHKIDFWKFWKIIATTSRCNNHWKHKNQWMKEINRTWHSWDKSYSRYSQEQQHSCLWVAKVVRQWWVKY